MARQTVHLTDVYIRSLKFEGKQRKIFDSAFPNFGVRLYKSGIVFIVMMGTERRMRTLGRYPELSLKNARQAAVAALSETEDDRRADISADDVIAQFVEHKARTLRPGTVSEYRRLLNTYFPKCSLTNATRSKILASLDKLATRPSEQQHAHTVFGVFLNWCIERGLLHTSPIVGLKKQGHNNKRDRILTDQELVMVWNRAGEVSHPYSTIVRLLILTGQRRGEIASLQPEWVNDGWVTLPSSATKNKREHSFPIGSLAGATLQFPLEYRGWSKAKPRFDAPLDID